MGKGDGGLKCPIIPNLIPSHFRDRFRTTVNVLGDTFGVGIVQHYSRKQLGPVPPNLISAATSQDSSSHNCHGHHHDHFQDKHGFDVGSVGEALPQHRSSPKAHMISPAGTPQKPLSSSMLLQSGHESGELVMKGKMEGRTSSTSVKEESDL